MQQTERNARLTLARAVEKWLRTHIPTTRESYGKVMPVMVAFIGPDVPLVEVEPVAVLDCIAAVKERDLSPATVNKHIITLKAFFNWAVDAGLLAESPARGVKRVKLPSRVDRSKAMPDEVLAQVLDCARWKKRKRDFALILFLADTGARIGGAAGLRVNDVHLDEGRAYVIEKGNKRREVWFGERCADALRQWLDSRPKGAGAFVFSRDGRKIQGRHLAQAFRRAVKDAECGTWSPHSLRHRKAYQLADAKTPPSVAATALGHSSPTITMNHYYPQDADRAEKAVRGVVTPRRADDPVNIVNAVDLFRRAAGDEESG